jgi:release factor glutamine methyltransferase
MTLIELINDAERRLTKAGIDTPRLDAEVLLAQATGMKRVDLYTNRGTVPPEAAQKLFEEMIRRRLENCPVAYITGVREFWSMPIRVTADVLIPRPESELIVERALEIIRTGEQGSGTKREINILDLGTGSGCIAAALAKELPHARLTVTDVSAEALDVARTNLTFAGERVEFRCGDLFDALSRDPSDPGSRITGHGLFDLIATNPPYIPNGHEPMLGREITEHEPRVALYGGKSGLDFAGRIIEDASRFLKPGGWVVMEMGLGQAEKLEAMAREFGGYADVVISRDLAGIERVISLWKN